MKILMALMVLVSLAGASLQHPDYLSGYCYPDPKPETGPKWNDPKYVVDKNIGDNTTGCSIVQRYLEYKGEITGVVKNITVQMIYGWGGINTELKTESGYGRISTIGGSQTPDPLNRTTYIIKNASRFNLNGSLYIRLHSPYSNLHWYGELGQYIFDVAYEIGYFQPPTIPNISEMHGQDWTSLNWTESISDTNTTVVYTIISNEEFITNTTDVYYDFSGLQPDTGYNFKILATDEYGLNSSSIITVRTDKQPEPQQPIPSVPVFTFSVPTVPIKIEEPKPIEKEIPPENQTTIFDNVDKVNYSTVEQPGITTKATATDGNIYYGVLSVLIAVFAVSYKKIKSRVFPLGAQKRRQNRGSPPKRPLRQISLENAEFEDALIPEGQEEDRDS
jgi:hypothetical protein